MARELVARLAPTLAIWAITGHVPSIATDTADNVGGEVALLGAVVFAMTDLAACTVLVGSGTGGLIHTILASLILVVAQGAVESS